MYTHLDIGSKKAQTIKPYINDYNLVTPKNKTKMIIAFVSFLLQLLLLLLLMKDIVSK